MEPLNGADSKEVYDISYDTERGINQISTENG